MTSSLIEPVDYNTALVARDTPQRRTELVPVVTMAIPIPERFAVQDAQELVQAVQQVLEIRRAQVDPARRMLLLRDSPSKVLLARRLLSDLSRLRAQVSIEVELLTVTKDYSRDLGFSLPTSSALLNLGNFLNNTISSGGFAQLATFGGGKTLFGLGVTEAQAFASMSQSLTESLLKAQVTAIDNQPVSLNVGSRYPIASAQFLGATAATTPTPTVTYQDLGLVLKITPTVQSGGQVSLDVDAAFTTLGATSSNGIPAIAQRKFQGKVRLGQGEWAVLAGLAQTTDSTSTTGIAGLARLPLLGHLFRTDTVEHDSDQTLIVLKPHIVSLPPWDFPTTEMEFGSETKPISLY
jgi:general secretion pathway protein D